MNREGNTLELSFCALRIVRSFLANPDDLRYGYSFPSTQISKQAAYAVLRRLTDEGWLERVTYQSTSRRPRFLYRITEKGIREGHKHLDKLQMSTASSAAIAGIPLRLHSGTCAILVARTL